MKSTPNENSDEGSKFHSSSGGVTSATLSMFEMMKL
jgi:hypothetical protein